MKAGYAALVSLVQTATELPFADCFTLTLLDGTVLRYTNLDVPVWLNGAYFQANAVRIQGLKFKQTTGVDIDEQEIDLIAGPTDLIKGVPVLIAIREHVLDACILQRDRAFFNPAINWPPAPLVGAVAAGGVTLFKGRIAAVTALGRTTAKINVKSNLVLLDIDFPRNLWQACCLHTLYDSGCGLNRGNYQSSGVAGAGSTNSVINLQAGGSGGAGTAVMAGTGGAAIASVQLTSPDTVNNAYAAAPVVTVTDPTGTGAQILPLLSPNYGGRNSIYGVSSYRLYGFIVLAGGSGYTNPSITVSAGGAGAATATATLGTGAQSVTGVSISAGGSGYSNAAHLVFSGGGGTGAAGVPIITAGAWTGVTMTNAGTGYGGKPSVAIVDTPYQNFSQGSLMFQGGLNAGVLVQIKSASATALTLAAPLIYAPAAGDAFTFWPGCDHTLGAGGCAKFNNQANFRGFPFVPPPETAY